MADRQQEKKQISATAEREEEVLQFWQNQGIFEKSLKKEAPQGEYVFYDGPPFATGLPHWGSLLSSISKDVVGRYKTMRGYHVPRRWGWDCHGLPIENMIEKELGLKSKKDIEKLGIDTFNEAARASVMKYADEWKRYVDRVGRFVDFDHSYKTLDNTYIESVWWALKKIYDDKRLYEGKKVLMYCPHCETPLSKAEIAMDNSYKDVTDEAAYVKFRITNHELGMTDDVPTYILAWTTTPWTLPGNVALAVGKDIEYVALRVETPLNAKITSRTVEEAEEIESSTVAPGTYIFAKDLFWKSLNENTHLSGISRFLKGFDKNDLLTFGSDQAGFFEKYKEGVSIIKGVDLVGLSYEPLYEVPKARAAQKDHAWTVLPADFVTTEDGTGVVHTAVIYGEDDYELGKEYDLPMVQLLDATGTFNADAPELVRGAYFKKGGKLVTADLEERGLLFAKHNYTHSYPHCYRCGTALIYNALTSWFIDIQSVKERLLAANEDIAWHPEHLKHGRFRHIVENAPDWTISRNRFWASPLPIWKHEQTGEITVIGSRDELRAHTKKSGNRYLFVRHGEADSNAKRIVSSLVENEHHLTDTGKKQVEQVIEKLQSEGVTKVITSPLVRTRETTDLIVEALGFDTNAVVVEDRFKEWQTGQAMNGKPIEELRALYPVYRERFTRAPEGGETLSEMKRRVAEALYELETTYEDETILIVTHEYVPWLAECVAEGATIDACVTIRGTNEDFVANGEIREINFVPLPHNASYELDFHRPYIDEVSLVADDGGQLVRIPEVVDCWVESGSMPFAAEHYPHEHKELVERRYPGDFIAEYIAQTRTWFYYMHALGILLFDAPSFKHCLTTGNVLAADGSKMSKSKANYTDPLDDMDVYGADAARLYLMSSVVMQAEDMSFKTDELKDMHNRTIGILWNTYNFYEMYGTVGASHNKNVPSSHVLDRWVMARLAEVTQQVTDYMDGYDTMRSVRMLREFVTDFSTWYLRRSRDRFKSDNDADRQMAIHYTREVLLMAAKLFAPLAPFIAESIYRGVGGEKESVHLEDWPEQTGEVDQEVLTGMRQTRELVSQALELRAQAGIKIRQPLAALTIPTSYAVYEELIKDELNIKEVLRGDTLELDTTITPELKQEGDIRELIRAVQDMRKKGGLQPEDSIVLTVQTDNKGNMLLEAARSELTRVAGVADIVFGDLHDTVSVSISGAPVGLHMKKK